MKVKQVFANGHVLKPTDVWAYWEHCDEFLRTAGSFRAYVDKQFASGTYALAFGNGKLTVEDYVREETSLRKQELQKQLVREYKAKYYKKGRKRRSEMLSPKDYSQSDCLIAEVDAAFQKRPENRILIRRTADEEAELTTAFESFLQEKKEVFLCQCDAFENEQLNQLMLAEAYAWFTEHPLKPDEKRMFGFVKMELEQLLRAYAREYMGQFGDRPLEQLRNLFDLFDPNELLEEMLPEEWEIFFLKQEPEVEQFLDRHAMDAKRAVRAVSEYLRMNGDQNALAVEAAEMAEQRITLDFVLNVLQKTKAYRNPIREYRKEICRQQQIQNAILEQIPENFIDLFPAARLMARHFVLHIGPTNSGKSYEALQNFREADSGVYLAPLRLLAFEVYENTNAAGVSCSMLTGEEMKKVPGARHVASTIEMLNFGKHYDVAVIDEGQMLEDKERGGRWTTAVLGVCADTVHVCAAPNALKILTKMIRDCGDTYEVVRHQRLTPISFDSAPFHFPNSVRKNDALIVFSKKAVIACAAVLQKAGWKVSTIYGALPYDVRQREVQKLGTETDVVVATDAIGMGLNLPIERVVFLETSKFDGHRKRLLNSAEVQQIAGRAGRKGVFPCGYYTSEFHAENIHRMYQGRLEEIKKVKVEFPRTLISVEGRLSELMDQWSRIPDRGIYEVGNIETQKKLCLVLEQFTEDKELVYRFVTIPFDERNETLYSIWLRLFHCMCQHEDYDASKYLKQDLVGMNLEQLENLYKIMDLLYYYYRMVGDDNEANAVSVKKLRISARIMELLEQQKLPERKCESCGRPLPWNAGYRYCDKCNRTSWW